MTYSQALILDAAYGSGAKQPKPDQVARLEADALAGKPLGTMEQQMQALERACETDK